MSSYVGFGDEEYEASYSPEATREALEDPRSKVELLAALARLSARVEQLQHVANQQDVVVRGYRHEARKLERERDGFRNEAEKQQARFLETRDDLDKAYITIGKLAEDQGFVDKLLAPPDAAPQEGL